jgi:uncharacterized membrane protein
LGGKEHVGEKVCKIDATLTMGVLIFATLHERECRVLGPAGMALC